MLALAAGRIVMPIGHTQRVGELRDVILVPLSFLGPGLFLFAFQMGPGLLDVLARYRLPTGVLFRLTFEPILVILSLGACLLSCRQFVVLARRLEFCELEELEAAALAAHAGDDVRAAIRMFIDQDRVPWLFFPVRMHGDPAAHF
jgi:hypothetical protein